MQNNIKLSILVCSVIGRRNTFLPKILNQLEQQASAFDCVEVLLLLDNKTLMLGEKRNKLVNMAQGKYITFVDDDDRLADDYVATLIETINHTNCLNVYAQIGGPDVINFNVSVSINGGKALPCFYSKEFKFDYNKKEAYFRIPNHIMCVKRELAVKTPYKNIVRGEDSAYSQDLIKKLKTQYCIDKTLYYYDFNSETTETQKELKQIKK